MLIAAGWENIPRLSKRWVRATAWSAITLLWVLAVAEFAGACLPRVPLARWTLVPGACVLLLGARLMSALYRREGLSPRWLYVFAGILFLHQLAVANLVFPALNAVKSPVEAGRAIQARLRSDQPLYIYQAQLAILPFCAERQGRTIDSLVGVRDILAGETNAVVVFPKRQWMELEPKRGGLGVAHEFRMGSKRLVWVDFRAPSPEPSAP